MSKRKTIQNRLPEVPTEQWELPVGITEDGHWITLKEASAEQAAALSFGHLSLDQQAELVAKRIEFQPEFELAMIGPGIVNKESAIQEVRSRSPIGRTLIEIEQRMIRRMVQRAGEVGS